MYMYNLHTGLGARRSQPLFALKTDHEPSINAYDTYIYIERLDFE